MRRNLAAGIIALGFSVLATAVPSLADDYQSPYEVVFSVPPEQLYEIDSYPPRNDFRLEANIPYEEWYTQRTRRQLGAWGPHPRHYPPLPNHAELPVTWKRQRVLAVAYRMVGLPYQHHHIPDWDPPEDWPWKPVAFGRNSRGVDCSDFTSWVYNYGLGIKLDTGVKEQAETTQIAGPGGDGTIDVEVIRDDDGYDSLVRKLKTGDLLYIRNKQGEIGHVIMWVGVHGRSPDGSPLIIDCTGLGHPDCNGVDIPIGVHLRPFLPGGWYYKSFSHAHRVLGE